MHRDFLQLKTRENRVCNAWTMTIYDLPGTIYTSVNFSTTPENIEVGFKVYGTYPYKRVIFIEKDFFPCQLECIIV